MAPIMRPMERETKEVDMTEMVEWNRSVRSRMEGPCMP